MNNNYIQILIYNPTIIYTKQIHNLIKIQKKYRNNIICNIVKLLI